MSLIVYQCLSTVQLFKIDGAAAINKLDHRIIALALLNAYSQTDRAFYLL